MDTSTNAMSTPSSAVGTNPIRILSFDIGIKNLAYCMFTHDTNTTEKVQFEINGWDIINIETSDKAEQADILFEKLHALFGDAALDYVIVENQPALKNPVMKTIQILVFAYFKHRKVINGKSIMDVRMINASNKIRCACKLLDDVTFEFKTPESNRYKRNKEAAIAYTYEMLSRYGTEENSAFFKTFKKKDDLADTLLQGIYFCSSFAKTYKKRIHAACKPSSETVVTPEPI